MRWRLNWRRWLWFWRWFFPDKKQPPGATANLRVIEVSENKTLAWDLPTHRVSSDGSQGAPLPISEIQHVLIEGQAPGSSSWSPAGAPVPPQTTELTIQNLIGGTWRFRAIVVDTENRRTRVEDAEVITVEIAVGVPGPTTNLRAVDA